MKITSTLLLLLLTLSLSNADEQNFIESYNSNIYGDIRMIGNTMLEPDSSKDRNDNVFFLSDDEVAYGRNITNGIIQDLWTGTWFDISTLEANNFSYLRYINVDNDGDNSIFNSSSSTLTLPADSTILFARVYWSGLFHNSNTGDSIDSDKTTSKTIKIKASTIDLGNGLDNFVDLTVNQTNNYENTEGWSELYTESNNLYYSRYSAYKDINLSAASFDGSPITFSVANVQSNEGWMRNYGNYAAWSLIVIYENSNESLKNVSLHTGYKLVFSDTLDFTISNFLTPISSSVSSKLSVFAVEGEKTLEFGDDYMKASNPLGTLIDVSNSTVYPNKNSNIFDSTITNTETKTPNIANTMGIDIDTFDIGVDGDLSHPQIIGNLQTTTTIELSSDGDAYTLNTLALSTELFIPSFCYDYAYKQYDRYFTEDNNGSLDPRITGSVSTSAPVEVSIFIRNLIASDIDVTDMNVSILDINTTQATYINGTTQLARLGSSPAPISVTSTDSSIDDIDIGTVSSNEYFYIYYNLDPKISDLDMPLNVQANYNLTIDGTTIPYTLTLGLEIPLCSSNNFIYTPETGIFNIVHNNYYPHSDGNNYYNLPTQVTYREGNFKAIGLKEDDHNQLEGMSTIVAVEIIDVAAFHDTYTSCQEEASSISERIWISFDNNSTSSMFTDSAIKSAIGLHNTITDSSQFYKNARENAAFRISYNVSQDANNNLVQTEKSGEEYKILNYADIAPNDGYCSQDVKYPFDELTTNEFNEACGSDGDFISFKHLQACMECIYGYNVKRVCSRDNFSIRPEAFLIHLDDQNQTNPNLQSRLTNDFSGVTVPTNTNLDLASGYNYNIEVNATNHIDNNASSGYEQSFFASSSSTTKFQYLWDARTGISTNACNDEENKAFDMRFNAGSIDANISLEQVGEYKLTINDTTWTTVDSNPTYMTHHTSPYFLTTSEDCILNTSTTQGLNAITNNGCNITSNHTNNHTNNFKSLIYNDYNVTFHPYKFDMNISSSVGLNNTEVNSTGPTASFYIYMADMEQDQNMSYHLNGSIKAVGYDNATLSNFVDGCYAKPISLTINKSYTLGAEMHQFLYKNTDGIGRIDTSTTDNNATTGLIVLGKNDFNKSNNGLTNTSLNMNFARNQTLFMNPKQITFTTYTSECTAPSECAMQADLNTVNTEGNTTLDNNITHYYGKSHAGRQRFEVATDFPYTTNIYYEIFCSGTIGTNTCNPSLLQNPSNLKRTDDSRWYINPNHVTSKDGNVSTVAQINSDTTVTTSNLTNATTTTVDHTYNGTSYPYKTTMDISTANWLLYNKYSSTINVNQYPIEFEKASTAWSGEADIDTTTKGQGSIKTNRRSMW